MKLKISIAVSAVFLLVVSSIRAAIPPAENLLPADTLLVLTVPDFSAVRASSQQSPEYLLWNDPAMKPFRDDFTARWDSKVLAPMEQNLGIDVSDYLPLLQGQLTFALTQNGWNGADNTAPAMLLLLDTKDKGDLLATNLAALNQKWQDSGRPVRTMMLQDIKFSVVTFSSNAPAMPFAPANGANGASSPMTLYVGQYKSLLIAGTSVKAVESVAAHLNGGANPSLVQNSQFAADQLSQFHDAPLYYGWFNAKTFFNVLSQIQPPDNASQLPFSWNSLLLASGFMGLKSVSFSYRESHDGAQYEFFVAAPESTRQGILKMVAAAPKDANPPPFVPADAMKFWRWRVDGQKSWGELEKTLGTVSPTALASLNSVFAMANATAQQKDPNFDLRKDLIENLGDDWISFARAPAGDSLDDLRSQPSLFLFAANNADQAVLAIETVAGMSGQGSSPQVRDFLGRKIYTIPLPARRYSANGTPASSSSLYCAASGGYVAITTDVSMIENYLRSDDGKTKPLSQTPGLVDAAQHVGGMDNGLFGYEDQRESARMLLSALKSDPATGSALLGPLSELPFAPPGAGFSDLMNFSLLPDYGAISKYFSFTVFGGSTTSDGLDYKFFQPRPPALN